MPNARARLATSPPMRPAPTRPSVFPCSSTPLKLLRSHSPARMERSAAGTRRTSASSSANVSSRRGDRVARGRREHRDAPLGRGVDVDRVDADAGAADDLEPLGPRERVARDLRGAAHEHGVDVRHRRGQRVARRARASSPARSARRRAAGASPSGAIASATSTRNDALTTQAPARARPSSTSSSATVWSPMWPMRIVVSLSVAVPGAMVKPRFLSSAATAEPGCARPARRCTSRSASGTPPARARDRSQAAALHLVDPRPRPPRHRRVPRPARLDPLACDRSSCARARRAARAPACSASDASRCTSRTRGSRSRCRDPSSPSRARAARPRDAEREAGRKRERLLRAGEHEVELPRVRLDRRAGDPGDAVDQQRDVAARVRDFGELLDRIQHAGGRLRVHDGDGVVVRAPQRMRRADPASAPWPQRHLEDVGVEAARAAIR